MSNNPVRIFDSQGRPLAVTAVGDGTYKLQVDTELTATIDPTGLATHTGQDELKALIGEVQASPTSNTVLDRLKSAVTHLATIAGFVSGGHGQVDVLESALPTGAATAANQQPPATTITEFNVTLTVVDTEYHADLPANCKGIEFVSRGGYPVRYAFTTGKVATPTGDYFTLKSNCSYESPTALNLSSKIIYFASDNAGDVVELIAWS